MCTYKKIEVVQYNSKWPSIFEHEKSIIQNALKENCVVVHHIGSTSVPGLIAKPKIDIIAVSKDRLQAISSLSSVGYVYRGEWNIPLKCGFVKKGGTNVNLHLFFDEHHPEIELNLLFRDYLRTHIDVANAYANLKKNILDNPENATQYINVGALQFPVYTIKKRQFIDEVLRKTGFSRLRVVKCITDVECEFAEKFYNLHMKSVDKTIDFSDTNYEHFILYRGVEICGYAMLQLSPHIKVILIETLDAEQKIFFSDLINKWISAHYC